MSVKLEVIRYSGLTPCIVPGQSTPVAEFLPSGHFRPGLCSRPSLSLLAQWTGGSGDETSHVQRPMGQVWTKATEIAVINFVARKDYRR